MINKQRHFGDLLRTYQLITENALIGGGQSFAGRKKSSILPVSPLFFDGATVYPARHHNISLLVDKL